MHRVFPLGECLVGSKEMEIMFMMRVHTVGISYIIGL